MRSSISAQSAASTPPASERMVTSASRESYGPDRSVRTSSSSMLLRSAVSSASASAFSWSSPASSAISQSTCASSRRRLRSSTRRISPCVTDSRLVTLWAFSGLSHRFGADACCSSSPTSARSLSRSRTASMLAMVVESSLSSAGTSVTSDHATRGPLRASRIELGAERLGGHLAVRVTNDLGDLVPIGIVVDPNPQPTPVADVGRTEVALGIITDARFLRTGRRRAPERQAISIVMVVVEHHEELLVTDEEPRLAVGRPFGGLGQAEADLAQPRYRR